MRGTLREKKLTVKKKWDARSASGDSIAMWMSRSNAVSCAEATWTLPFRAARQDVAVMDVGAGTFPACARAMRRGYVASIHLVAEISPGVSLAR